MTIAFTGGGTGGHFYPIVAIAEAINDLVREKKLVPPKLYYLAPNSFDQKALFENNVSFISIPAGKRRRYASFQNFVDLFVSFWGLVMALFTLFRIYPDVVVSKGGYGSVPTVIAAHLLRIPIIIHESDAKPGRANLLAAPWAEKIAISFASAADFFPEKVREKIARTGIPIRKALAHLETEGAQQYLGLEKELPTILILGGSQGAQRINEVVLSALPDLVGLANIIHQTGPAHIQNVEGVAQVVLTDSPNVSRYHPVNYLSQSALQRVAGVANLIVTRAGASSITEVSLWGKPSILIPIPETISHDQRSNAYSYARTGAAIVLEEENLTPHLLVSEARRILSDTELEKKMGSSAAGFADPDAARVLAEGVLSITLSHEV